MRTRTAKKLAQRIDLDYFKQVRGMRRWRGLLSLAAPLAALLWLGSLAAAGDRTIYSTGPLSNAHAFVDAKCEVCHTNEGSFRSHVADTGCLACHDAPPHPGPVPHAEAVGHATPECASCHREHQGRVALAATADRFCADCHGDLPTLGRARAFPADHAEFAVLRDGYRDPGTLRFNHAVHNNPALRGPNGAERLECTSCHRPEIARVSSQRRVVTGLMASMNYEQQCARCHPLFFDERIETEAPHEPVAVVRGVVRRSLSAFIAAHPAALSEPDPPSRRTPLNFPRLPEPPARTPEEWVARRTARAERLLVDRACSYCHGPAVRTGGGDDSPPEFQPTRLRTQWMPRARFDHAPHLMVECASCHTGADTSRETADVLMPAVATCATCHSPSKGASAQCVECHGYHDWTKARPVSPRFKVTDFQ